MKKKITLKKALPKTDYNTVLLENLTSQFYLFSIKLKMLIRTIDEMSKILKSNSLFFRHSGLDSESRQIFYTATPKTPRAQPARDEGVRDIVGGADTSRFATRPDTPWLCHGVEFIIIN